MKAPDAALLRARAKAPLTDLRVLHLSNADIACLRNLEGCRRLQSLYANGNVLKEVGDGLTSLQSLWRIDLSDNRLGQLTGLASFRALGFLHLQRNRLTWGALVCLRDVHILDLRLTGNPNLLPKNADRASTTAYRMRVVALLPSVWTLDGHFVTTSDRAQAVEAYDDWVLELLARHREAHDGSALRFGSTSDLWGGAHSMGDPDNNVSTIPIEQDVFKLLQVIEKQPTRNPDHQDLYRLRALASFHDSECDVHNVHAHFAPHKHSPTAKPMPKLRLRQLQMLPPRTRLEFSVLLAAHVEFPLPVKLLSEAMTIAMLSDGDSDPASVAWVQDLVLLPAYGIVTVVSALRSQALEAHEHTSATGPLDDSIQLWRTVPVVLQTLLHSERHVQLVERSTPDPSFLKRCVFAVSLLSRAGAFPLTSAAQASHRDLRALVETAKLAPTATHEETSFVIPTTLLSSPSEMPWKKANVAMPDREYRKPWKERYRLATAASSPDIQTFPVSQRRRAPKPGEWLQVRPKLFFKICSVSARGDTLKASPATANNLHSAMVTLSIDHVARVSSSMWRVASDDPHTLEEIMKLVNEAPTTANRRLGKLHRDSEGFHKHGASRNQGYPNHDVSTEDLRRASRREEDASALFQPLPVEVFSATATLDANYVLTSPAMISVQNDVASRAFHAQRQPPAGLWNPIETASYSMALPLEPSKPSEAETTPVKSTKPKFKILVQPPQSLEDDWLELRRDMQMLLGIQARSPSLPLADDSADVKCFMTSVEAAAEYGERSADSQLFPSDTEITSTPSAPTPTPSSELSARFLSPPVAMRSTARPRKLASLPWHQVPTKPQLLVAAASPIPPRSSNTSNSLHDAKTTPVGLTSHAPTKELDAAAAASVARPLSTASRVPLRLMRCHVSLPSLSLVSPE